MPIAVEWNIDRKRVVVFAGIALGMTVAVYALGRGLRVFPPWTANWHIITILLSAIVGLTVLLAIRTVGFGMLFAEARQGLQALGARDYDTAAQHYEAQIQRLERMPWIEAVRTPVFLDLHPQSLLDRMRISLAQVRMYQNRIEEGLSLYHQAVENDPKNTSAQIMINLVRVGRGEAPLPLQGPISRQLYINRRANRILWVIRFILTVPLYLILRVIGVWRVFGVGFVAELIGILLSLGLVSALMTFWALLSRAFMLRHARRARRHFRQGDYRAAIAHYNRQLQAIQEGIRLPRWLLLDVGEDHREIIWLSQATAYVMIGDGVSAAACYESVLSHNPDNRRAPLLLRLVRPDVASTEGSDS